MIRKLITLSALLFPAGLMAHDGHGHTHGFTIKHYFTEPEHMLLSGALVIVATLLIVQFRRRKKTAGNNSPS